MSNNYTVHRIVAPSISEYYSSSLGPVIVGDKCIIKIEDNFKTIIDYYKYLETLDPKEREMKLQNLADIYGDHT